METPALSTMLPREMTEVRVRPLFTFVIDVAKPFVIGKTPALDRRVGEVLGGRFEGERLAGKILTSGSDWQQVIKGLVLLAAVAFDIYNKKKVGS